MCAHRWHVEFINNSDTGTLRGSAPFHERAYQFQSFISYCVSNFSSPRYAVCKSNLQIEFPDRSYIFNALHALCFLLLAVAIARLRSADGKFRFALHSRGNYVLNPEN